MAYKPPSWRSLGQLHPSFCIFILIKNPTPSGAFVRSAIFNKMVKKDISPRKMRALPILSMPCASKEIPLNPPYGPYLKSNTTHSSLHHMQAQQATGWKCHSCGTEQVRSHNLRCSNPDCQHERCKTCKDVAMTGSPYDRHPPNCTCRHHR